MLFKILCGSFYIYTVIDSFHCPVKDGQPSMVFAKRFGKQPFV